MRILGLVAASAFAVVSACGKSASLPAGGDGTMVLELGGNQASLRGALAKAGIQPAPAIALIDEPAPTPAPSQDDAAGRKPAPAPDRQPAPAPDRQPDNAPDHAPDDAPPKPSDEPAYTTVTLGQGQTLIHLARKHLGDGNRFREILELNGWSEAESRRLKPGTKVKVPKPAATRRSAR